MRRYPALSATMNTTFCRLVTLGCLVLVMASCATLDINLPPVSETPTHASAPGKIIWHDLLTNDPAASKRFYRELFGWEFEEIGADAGFRDDTSYSLIRHNGRLIGGMIDTVALNGRDDISQWVALMSVVDIDAAAAGFAAAGGEIVAGPRDLKRRGRIAVVRDAEGALLGLLQTRDGDPPDVEPEIGGFLWDELWTTNVDAATTLYATVGGLRADDVNVDVSGGPAAYRLLKSGDRPRVGIMRNPLPDLRPVWVNYLRVEHPQAITARVAEFGGRVIVEARPRPLGGEVAFIAGPSGAGIALQTWPVQRNEELSSE